MFVDLHSDMIFEHSLSSLPSAKKREFQTSQPDVIPKYVTAKTGYLTDHHFFARLQVLDNLQHPNHDLAESLDRDFQRAAFHAAKVCTKKPKPPWSPQLAKVWAELHYYRLILSSQTTTAKYTAAIEKLRRKWPDLPNCANDNRCDIVQRQKQSLNRLKQIRTEAQKLREEFLLKRYAQSLEDDDTQTARILQRILHAENQKKVYHTLRTIRNNEQGKSRLNCIKIPRDHSAHDVEVMKRLPDNDDHWMTITVPQQIEQLLIQRNQQHFGQAHGTPFTRPPLAADVGYKADGSAVECILSGQLQYENINPATTLFLKHLQKQTLQTLDSSISYNDVLYKLKKWHESTTTSPSGLHLGHYHCCWKDPRMDSANPDRETIIHAQKQLLKATVSLLNYAIKFGHSYERWTKVINIMLEKDVGNPRIHRLRVIHIYEADYNLLLAVKWRQALYHAEDNNLLNDGLYGSRPGRTAHDPALMEVLQNETYRMSMKPGINYDLDAASCYDRILTSVAVLSSQRMGLPPQVTHVNALTLERAHYHIKTQAGVSPSSYFNTNTTPIHGTGQGSGNSPTIWCFVCSALFDAVSERAHGATFHDYSRRLQCDTCITGFVDDCTQRVNLFNCHRTIAPLELISRMEHDAQLWNDLLWSSGGALEQSKCSYHLIESAWNSNGHPFLKGGTTTPVIKITHQTNCIPTTPKSNYEAHKTLGCYINPAFTHTQAWIAIKTKNNSLASILESNMLSRHEAWTFYTSIYLPSVTYPLPITPLARTQCHQLDSRFLRSLLPRCGYNRNMSSAIRYAPHRVGGAGFKEMYLEQSALLLQQITKYFNSPDTTIGKFLFMAASWTQAFLGTATFFLEDVTSPIPPANPSLLLELRIMLKYLQGSIRLRHPPIPTLLRESDRCIMDIALSQNGWKKIHMTQINSCRRYLQVQTLADITNLQGTRLQSYAVQGDNVIPKSLLKVSCFNQQRPHRKAWRTWHRFLRTISNSFGVLTRPLGRWTVDAALMRHWPAYLYDPTTDTLMSHATGDMYQQHRRIRSGCFSLMPDETSSCIGHGFPTATNITMGTLRPECNFIPPQPQVFVPFQVSSTQWAHLEQWEYDLIRGSRALCPTAELQAQLKSRSVISCSDGSVKGQQGGYGFVIATKTGRRLVRGNGSVPGSFQNSFRSEAFGVLSTLVWLHHAYQDILPDHPIVITHYIDNQSVLRRISNAQKTKRRVPNTWLLPDQDVIEEIKVILRQLPVTVKFEWVRGHQDDSKEYHRLPLEAQLNCEADEEANQGITSTLHPNLHLSLPHVPCQLQIHGDIVTGHLKRRVHEAHSIPSLLRYLQVRFQWSQATFDAIDWSAYEKIIKKYKDRWTTLVKHLHSISPTGKIAHRNNPMLPHECPICMAPQETSHHVIQCPHPSRAQWRQDTITSLTRCYETEIDPYLSDILRDGITRYHRQLANIPPEAYPPKYADLIIQQNAIGWNQLYQGRWSQEWTQMQDQHSQSNGAQYIKGGDWILKVGRLLIDRWFKVWEQRNKERHSRDNEQLQEQRSQLLHNELRRLYELQPKVCPGDRKIFYTSPDIHLQQHQSLDQLEDWITTFKPVIMTSVEQAKHLGLLRNTLITDYPAFNSISLTHK